jgi:hypothetical protein
METDTEPIRQRVAANLKQLRGRVTVRELSGWLSKLGRPILPSGITKIEQGSRGVDADDLVALSLALGCSPNRLLLDAEADEGELSLTPAVQTTRRRAWEWATGDAPLPDLLADPLDGDDPGVPFVDFDRVARFRRANRPNEPEGTPFAYVAALEEALRPVDDAVNEAIRSVRLSDGSLVTIDTVIEYLTLRRDMARLSAQVRKATRKRGRKQ